MRLIGLAVVLTLSLLLALLTAEARAQQPAKVHLIGYLVYGSPTSVAHRTEALRMGLRDLGYVEGKNITIAFRSAETTNRLPEVAADLVRLNVDVIFATSSTEVEAARQATKTIPIVFATHADPERVGPRRQSCAARRQHHGAVVGIHRDRDQGTRDHDG